MNPFEVKMRMKINVDTQSDVLRIVDIASRFDDDIKIEVVDDNGMRVNARSLIGMMYAMTFSNIWLESSEDVYVDFAGFSA